MMKNSENKDRYQRQISLKELGEAGQQRRKMAKVLVIGAGGLGCPALLYLAGAGVGSIGIVDFDVVSLNNLHRQVLFSMNDIGVSKAIRAAELLGQLNPDIEIAVFNQKISTENALEIFEEFDIILDGTDNFASRYLINDACVILDKVLVYGAISRFEGQLAVFNAASNTQRKLNYRDLFPKAPVDGSVLNCEEAGVIGVLPGIIGTMMANETIKLITEIGDALINRLLTYNALNNHFFEIELQAMPETELGIPKDATAFKAFNYAWFCSTPSPFEIQLSELHQMRSSENIQIIDVREEEEPAVFADFDYVNIPLSSIREQIPDIHVENIVLFCQSGKRSAVAAEILSKHYGKSKKIYTLKDGIAGWQKT